MKAAIRIAWLAGLAAIAALAAFYSVGYVRVLTGAWGAWGELSADYFLHPRFTIYIPADGLMPQPNGPPQIHYTGQRGIEWFRVADPPTGVDPAQWSIPSLAIAAPSSALLLFTLSFAVMSFRPRQMR